MKGERTERRKFALKKGCLNWEDDEKLCLMDPCACLVLARQNISDRAEDKRWGKFKAKARASTG